ncbi:flavin-containing monooxygenase [Saccharothrix syringae]|uniref:NAD(P)/FAD-dependent oxidoreductase n=1 Tax=Saccharothrix syringae TaxID=103733 RepID=A0A5Q0GXW9_SACSY|nr:NAD(P)/FAD-dependent oxidoreductase [Saccharothrix syringae]QFZ18801.1 NAD(P)/FAD-dependent oxidoreductase [Saccharothrix syringae]
MTLDPTPLPITADDDELRRHLAHAEVPALLLTVAHLTGDTSVLPDDRREPGWLFAPQGGLTPAQQERAREVALRVLAAHRDGGRAAPPAPDPGLLRALTTWAMGGDTTELVPLLAEEVTAPGADPRAPGWTAAELAPGAAVPRVVVIGAGPSGLLVGHRLAQAGVPFVIHEKNPDVGGTWFDNTYPGCRIDVASRLYDYSFAPRSDWPDHFCTRDEVLRYFRRFARDTGVAGHVRFRSEVVAAAWDDRASRWRLTVRTPRGVTEEECDVLVSAVGQLNRPRLPDVPGRDEFAGPAFHTARWDHSVDLRGKRVAVVGTGASAFQVVPEIAPEVAGLVVFQRNPPWLRPTPHYRAPMSDSARWLREHVPFYARWERFWLFAPGLRGILENWVVDHGHPPTERAVSAPNEAMRAALEAAMRAQLADAPPELAEAVLPRYPVGAKRVLRDDGRWIATLKRDDVRLVTEPVRRVTPGGVVAGGVEHEVDVIVYATGFRASEFLAPMRVTGRGGVDLHGAWNGVPRAYLGLTVPGFPNLFCLYGPNTNLVGQGGSIVYFSECAARYVLDAVRLLLTRGRKALEVRKDVHDDYNAWVDEGNANRAWGWSKVGGWYNEGGRSAPNWPYSAHEYWRRTRRVDPADYELS